MHIYSYNIALRASPLHLTTRQGLIFETNEGWGEAAPLIGRNQETLLEALQGSTPSSHFACISAARSFPNTYPPIAICALASTSSEIMQAIEDGFQTIKIKCKNQNCDQLLQTISILPSHIHLRLDMNQQWSFIDTLRFIQNVNPAQIEYIEEPLADPSQIFLLPPFPIALDESLQDPRVENWIDHPQITAIILKPTVLGKRLDTLIQKGLLHHKKIVFSSCFESAIGLLHIAHLQMRYAPEVSAGLDTYRFFINNFLPYPIRNGRLETTPLPPVDRSCLFENVL